MLLYTMLYIVLAYLMLFAALTNSVCLNNASFFFLFKYFLCQGYELSGEIALKNNHYYYYYSNDLIFHTNHLPMTRYPQLAIGALIMLCLYRSTYLYETFFSKMKLKKNKYRTSLTDTNLENTLRFSTTSIVPNIEELVDRVQWHNKSEFCV